MELFTYLMAKNDHNTSVKKDLFSYLLGKNQSGTYTDYSGTSLSINNTKKAKMKVNLLGNTSQTGTPTPDNPIPINVVSGNNTITTYGSNIFDLKGWLTANNISYTENSDGSLTFSTTVDLYNNPLVFSDTNISVSLSGLITAGTATNPRFQLLNSSNTVVGEITTSTSKRENISACKIRFNYSTSGTVTIKNIMLNTGATATPYEPYQSSTYPIHLGTLELCKIGTYQDKFIRNSGKNLFDISKVNNLALSETIVYNTAYRGYSLKVNPGEKYTISRKEVSVPNRFRVCFTKVVPANNVAYYGEDGNEKSYVELGSSISGTIIVPSEMSYMFVYLSNYDETITNGMEIQIEKGTTATSYEPYGNGDWYLEKELAKTQVSLGNTVYDIGIYKGSICQPPNKAGLYNGTAYCSKSLIATTVEERVENRFYENPANFMFIGSSTDTATTLKEKFDGSDLYYVLATPTYTKITGTLAEQLEDVWRANSYKGQTNINQVNNDLPFELDVSVKVGS